MASRPVLPGGFFGAPDKLVDTLVRCWPARRRRDARAQDMVPKVSMIVSHWDDAGFRETKNYPNAGLNAAVANFETVFVNADLTSGKGGGQYKQFCYQLFLRRLNGDGLSSVVFEGENGFLTDG